MKAETSHDTWIFAKSLALAVIGTRAMQEIKDWSAQAMETTATMIVVTIVLFFLKKLLNWLFPDKKKKKDAYESE